MATPKGKILLSKKEMDDDKIIRLMRHEPSRVKFSSAGKKEKFQVFGRVIIDNKETIYVVCNQCNDKPLIVYNQTFGTGNLNRHLKTHVKPDKIMKPVDQPKIDYYLEKQILQRDKVIIADAAAICCAVDLRPFTFIEGKGFQLLVQAIIKFASINGLVKASDLLPSANTVKNHLKTQCELIKSKLVKDLDKIDYVNFTCDHWLDEYNKKTYLTITIQYFDPKEEKLINRVIGTFAVDDKKNASTSDNVKQRLQQLKIESKVRLVTTRAWKIGDGKGVYSERIRRGKLSKFGDKFGDHMSLLHCTIICITMFSCFILSLRLVKKAP